MKRETVEVDAGHGPFKRVFYSAFEVDTARQQVEAQHAEEVNKILDVHHSEMTELHASYQAVQRQLTTLQATVTAREQETCEWREMSTMPVEVKTDRRYILIRMPRWYSRGSGAVVTRWKDTGLTEGWEFYYGPEPIAWAPLPTDTPLEITRLKGERA